MGIWQRLTGRSSSNNRVDALVSTMTNADGWKNIMTLLGTPRDKRSGGVFDSERLAYEQQALLWKQNSLAARIIEKKAKAAMRRGYDVSLQNKDQSKAIDHIMRRSGANRQFVLARMYERAYGGAGLMPIINDGSDHLAEPLQRDRIQRIDGYNVYSARELYPMAWYDNPNEANYGKPEIYRIQPVMRGSVAMAFNRDSYVHESRLIKFPGIQVDNMQSTTAEPGWGDAETNRVHEALRDIGLNFGNVAALMQDFSQGVFRMNNLAKLMDQARTEAKGKGGLNFVSTAENEVAMRLLIMDQMRSILRALVIDKDDDFKREQTPVTGLADLLDRFIIWFACISDIPVTVLFGVSPAGLNATGESDIRLWDERVEDDQDHQLPQLEQLVELNLLAYEGPVKGKVPDSWEIKYRPLRQANEKDQAQARYFVAQTDQLYWEGDVASREEVANSRWGGGAYSPDMTIDWDAREKQQLAAPPVYTETPDPTPDPNAPIDPNAAPPSDPTKTAKQSVAIPPKADPNAKPAEKQAA